MLLRIFLSKGRRGFEGCRTIPQVADPPKSKHRHVSPMFISIVYWNEAESGTSYLT